MATVRESINKINNIRQSIEHALGRCGSSYPLTKDFFQRINDLRDRYTTIYGKVAGEHSRILADIAQNKKTELQNVALSIKDKGAEITQANQQLKRLQTQQAQIQTQLTGIQQQISQTSIQMQQQQHQQAIMVQLQNQSSTLFQQQSSSQQQLLQIQQQITQTQQTLNTIQQEQQEQQSNQQQQQQRIEQQYAQKEQQYLDSDNPALADTERELLDIIQQVGDLETQMRSGDAIKRIVETDFESKITQFQEAAVFHRREANKMLWLMALTLVITVGLICMSVIFIRYLPVNGEIQNIEKYILLAIGKFAPFLFGGWALSVLARHYRSNSEQAVIYRDRIAALPIAQSLLNSTVDLEQRKEFIKTLAECYLNFRQNAFRLTGTASKPVKFSSIAKSSKEVKEVIDSTKNLVDSVNGVTSKKT